MACPLYITELSQQIWNDLWQPSGQPPSYIQSKLVSAPYLGKLNNYLATCYVAVSGSIVPELGETEQAIYALMYQSDYFGTKLLQTLAGLSPGVLELRDGDSALKFVNPVEQAKVYKDMQRQINGELGQQVASYRQQNSQPSSVNYPFIVNGVLGDSYAGDQSNLHGYYRS